MSKWEEIEFKDVILGDKIKIAKKEGGMSVILKGEVTNRATLGDWFTVGNEESFYPSEFIEEEAAGNPAKLYRKVKPFAWPNKQGAIVEYTDCGNTFRIVLVAVDKEDTKDPYPDWYHPMYGLINKADLEAVKELKIISKGVDVP